MCYNTELHIIYSLLYFCCCISVPCFWPFIKSLMSVYLPFRENYLLFPHLAFCARSITLK